MQSQEAQEQHPECNRASISIIVLTPDCLAKIGCCEGLLLTWLAINSMDTRINKYYTLLPQNMTDKKYVEKTFWLKNRWIGFYFPQAGQEL